LREDDAQWVMCTIQPKPAPRQARKVEVRVSHISCKSTRDMGHPLVPLKAEIPKHSTSDLGQRRAVYHDPFEHRMAVRCGFCG
jgi:hypothetical protein